MSTQDFEPLLYLNDLTVGRRFASSAVEVTREAIQAFAAQFDPQPFHLDPAGAKESFFKTLVASGWHTASISMSLMVQSIPVAGGLIGFGVEDLRWHQPVHPGDRLRVESEILSVRVSRSRPEQGFVRFRHTLFNQEEAMVQSCLSTIVAPVRPAG